MTVERDTPGLVRRIAAPVKTAFDDNATSGQRARAIATTSAMGGGAVVGLGGVALGVDQVAVHFPGLMQALTSGPVMGPLESGLFAGVGVIAINGIIRASGTRSDKDQQRIGTFYRRVRAGAFIVGGVAAATAGAVAGADVLGLLHHALPVAQGSLEVGSYAVGLGVSAGIVARVGAGKKPISHQLAE